MRKNLKRSIYVNFLLLLIGVLLLSGLNLYWNIFRFEKREAENIAGNIALIDESVSLYRELLSQSFRNYERKALQVHHEIAAAVGNDPHLWNENSLGRLKKAIEGSQGGIVDIALISPDLTIETTTYAPEQGLNLAQFPDAKASFDDVLQSGNIRVDLPVYEPAGNLFRAYSASFLRGQGQFLQVGHVLEDFTRFAAILNRHTVATDLLDSLDLYLVHRLDDGTLQVTSFTDAAATYPAERVESIEQAIKNKKMIVREHRADGRSLREYYKMAVKEDPRHAWFADTDNFLVYRLTIDLTDQNRIFAATMNTSLFVFAGIAFCLIISFIRFRSEFVAPCETIVKSIGASCPVDPGIARDKYDELRLISDTYNSHLATIRQDREQLSSLNSALTEKNTQLQEALQTVKTLSGMLPICASCKMIRADTGYWLRVEEYLQNHLDVSFTHGICPTCLKKDHPDIYRQVYPDNPPAA